MTVMGVSSPSGGGVKRRRSESLGRTSVHQQGDSITSQSMYAGAANMLSPKYSDSILSASQQGVNNVILLRNTRPTTPPPPRREAWTADSLLPPLSASVIASRQNEAMLSDKSRVVRSLLLNFIHDRDGSIKKRLDLGLHQLESGRTVTDATVQELCRMCPDTTGLLMKDCAAITDVALWAIARHATSIKEISMAGCTGITDIGLRSLALRCRGLETLDLSGATCVDDLALRVLAGGCWALKSLTLVGCTEVSEMGIETLAKLCTGLTHLNVSGCPRIGEYGDKALLALGKYCKGLKKLEALGCQHVQDHGLMCLAQGCSGLQTLLLTGCSMLTGAATLALSKNLPDLQELSLAGCVKLTNADIAHIAIGCKGLRRLDLAGCVNISTAGVMSVAKCLPRLTDLDLSGCININDQSLKTLTNSKIRRLKLKGCKGISENGLKHLSVVNEYLDTCDVTGCTQIGRGYMTKICQIKRFVEMADEFFGFKPRANAAIIQAQVVLENRTLRAAVRVNHFLKARLKGNRIRIQKKREREKRQILRAQAVARGFLTRNWYRNWLTQVHEHMSAELIQAAWRGRSARKVTNVLRAKKADRLAAKRPALCIQLAWRAACARHEVQHRRNIRAQVLLEEAREEVRRQVSVVHMQRLLRGCAGRARVRHLRALEEETRKHQVIIHKSAVHIAGLFMVKKAKKALDRLRAEERLRVFRWEMAVIVQRAWRGRKARMFLSILMAAKREKILYQSAVQIQSFWRRARAKHLFSLQKALYTVRQSIGKAVIKIQKVWRGYCGRQRFARFKAKSLEDNLHKLGATCMQKVYRGHRGRERAECSRVLIDVEKKARPLRMELETLEENLAKDRKELQRLVSYLIPMKLEAEELVEELQHVSITQEKYTDSAKVNGVRQRFLTKFLQVRLTELQGASAIKVADLEKQKSKMESVVRQKERLIRQVHRELLPLSKGAIDRVRTERNARLRYKIRRRDTATRTIQRVYRGYRVRKAVYSWYRDYWIAQEDPATGDVYYYNTWSQEARWIKPLELSLFENSYRITQDSTSTPAQPAVQSMITYNENEDHDVLLEDVIAYKKAIKQAAETQALSEKLLEAEKLSAELHWVSARAPKPYSFLTFWHCISTLQYRWNPQNDGTLSDQDVNLIDFLGATLEQKDLEPFLDRSEKLRGIGPDWYEMRDNATSCIYYYSPVAGECTWSLSPMQAFGVDVDT